MGVARVAVSGIRYSLDRPYDYAIPENMRGLLRVGMRVTVPFSRSNRPTEGIVLDLRSMSDYEKIKPILSCLDDEVLLTAEQIKLAAWMHDRFFCTFYEAARTMLPMGLWLKKTGGAKGGKYVDMLSLSIPAEEALELAVQKSRTAAKQAEVLRTLSATGRVSASELREFTGATSVTIKKMVESEYIKSEREEVLRRPKLPEGKRVDVPTLSAEQSEVTSGIVALMDKGEPAAALLMGVTGSGKTSVYMNLIKKALDMGRSALMLVPEIALTPQMIESISSHFGDSIAVMHSSLSTGERFDEWKRVRRGDAKLVIGTRSAVFAPLDDLGLIIIDEEQEETYKSENSPRYHARDVAQYRCSLQNSVLVLGSATPDVESRYKAEIGKYSYFELKSRYMEKPLPSVELVDMRDELRGGNGGSISGRLKAELSRNIENGEQSILFLNRRGANKLIVCAQCGYTYECENCSVSLTYHSYGRKLMCHYCGHTRRSEDNCPDCGGILKYMGVGTQKLEEELKELFPEVEVLRMDADTVSKAGGHEKLLTRFRTENVPIMLGTQMVTKGLNFPNVTLVGVVFADQSLYSGSYRAFERTFSLITQVVGRSGRFERPGRAIIQTMSPNNQVLRQAAAQDYNSFFESELRLRHIQGTPPFTEIISIAVTGAEERRVLDCALEIKAEMAASLVGQEGARVIGPAPMPILKVNGRYRYKVTIMTVTGTKVRARVSDIIKRFNEDKRYRQMSVYADSGASD